MLHGCLQQAQAAGLSARGSITCRDRNWCSYPKYLGQLCGFYPASYAVVVTPSPKERDWDVKLTIQLDLVPRLSRILPIA